MDRFSMIEVFVFLVLLELLILGVLIPVNTRGPHYRYASFDIFVLSNDVIIIPLDDTPFDTEVYDRWYNHPDLIGMDSVMIRPHRERGPWPGVFAFYSSERCFSSLDDLNHGFDPGFDIDLDESGRQRVFDALVTAAERDPWLTRYQPGASERIVFRPDLLGVSLIQLILFFGIPALGAKGISIIQQRVIGDRRLQKCVHCGYDCRDLPTPNCPECGKRHGVCA